MPDWIYLDNNATTQPLDTVCEATRQVETEAYANPSSVHPFGQGVRHRIETARAQVAAALGGEPRAIVFTSGGTEAINLAIRGTLAQYPDKRHFVTTAAEHSAGRRLAQQLAREDCAVDAIGVDAEGRVNLDELAEKINDATALVSVLWANNETGVLNDVEAIARVTRNKGVPLHLDAVQAVGKVPIDVGALPVQLLSVSGHKFHGPKGVGALYVQPRSRLRAQIVGGRQERDLRGGTENVAGIVGMGVAIEAATADMAPTCARMAKLRDRLEAGICAAVERAQVHGGGAPRIANTSNMGFRGLPAEGLLILLGERGICASSGSACSSGSLEPSHVLQAMGVPIEYAHGALRFSLSRFTTEAEIDRTVAAMPEIVQRLAGLGG